MTSNEFPPLGELADDKDELGWSWDELTGGEREEMADEEAVLFALFAGVPDDEIDQHAKHLWALGGGDAVPD